MESEKKQVLRVCQTISCTKPSSLQCP